jgi:hypothetical protein
MVRRSCETLALTQIETVDPGDYQRTIRHTGYLEPERAFLTYSKELTTGIYER